MFSSVILDILFISKTILDGGGDQEKAIAISENIFQQLATRVVMVVCQYYHYARNVITMLEDKITENLHRDSKNTL